MWCMILDFYIVFIFIMRKVSLDRSFSADDVLFEKTATTTKILFTLYRIEFITACIEVVKRRYTEIIHHFIIFGFYDAGFGLMLTSSYTNAHNSSMFWKEENGGHVNFAERKYFIQYDVEYIKTSMRNPMWMYKRWNKSEYNLMMELHTYSLE